MLFVNALGGLALFLYGMKLMSGGLQKAAGEKMRSILRFFSANRLAGVFSGAVVTSIIQSSSVTTVMVIGFINAGLLTLTQAIGIIFGANIGTTMTAQLVAFQIHTVVMPAIVLGMGMGFFPNRRAARLGETVLGFGLLCLGMEIMGGELKQLAKHPAFLAAFQTFRCVPVDGVIPPGPLCGAIGVGLISTVLVQSSSATIGVVIALSGSGLLNLYTAAGIVLGTEIGTTVTAQLAALTANRVARQAALAHTLFNVIGVLLAVAAFRIPCGGEPLFFSVLRRFSAHGSPQREIANAHTLFNVATTLILLPFVPTFAKICEAILPVRTRGVKFERLEPHLLRTPSIALSQTAEALTEMLKRASRMVDDVLALPVARLVPDAAFRRQLHAREEHVDRQQRMISEYLTRLMLRPLSPRESRQIPLLLHCANDAEKIGDYALEMDRILQRMEEQNVRFSPTAGKHLLELKNSLKTLAAETVGLLAAHPAEQSAATERSARKFEKKLDRAELAHLARIHAGQCGVECGVLFMELLERLRKTERHLRNIAERSGQFYGKIPHAV